jgi:hypothetical protein
VGFSDEPGPDTAVVACTAGRHGIDGTAWHHPRRPSINSGAVNGGAASPAQQVLDAWATVTDLDLVRWARGAVSALRLFLTQDDLTLNGRG